MYFRIVDVFLCFCILKEKLRIVVLFGKCCLIFVIGILMLLRLGSLGKVWDVDRLGG